MKRFYACVLLAPLLFGCAPAQLPQAPAAGAGTGEAWYRQAARREPVYRIDAAHSLIAVTVRRGGPFARFGHDHVVASRGVEGYVAPRSGRADFHFRVDQLSVDETALRTAAGLDTTPSADAIAGTRTNMLTRVLQAERYPLVLLHAERVAGDPARLRLAVTLHGVTRTMLVPTTIAHSGTTLVASGSLRLLQTDFGITPMSIMGGALKVEDPIEMRFTIVARPGLN